MRLNDRAVTPDWRTLTHEHNPSLPRSSLCSRDYCAWDGSDGSRLGDRLDDGDRLQQGGLGNQPVRGVPH